MDDGKTERMETKQTALFLLIGWDISCDQSFQFPSRGLAILLAVVTRRLNCTIDNPFRQIIRMLYFFMDFQDGGR